MDAEEYKNVYSTLLGNKKFHELDCMERLIVPILHDLGWPVDERGCEWQLLRGDRNHKGTKKERRRRFDLNLFADTNNKSNVSVAIECKEANAVINIPDDGQEPKPYETAGNKTSLAQILDQLFDPRFGIDDVNQGITQDYTIGVWTNGIRWIVVCWGNREGQDGNGWKLVPQGFFPPKFLTRRRPDMSYKIFDIANRNEFDQLKYEIGFTVMSQRSFRNE